MTEVKRQKRGMAEVKGRGNGPGCQKKQAAHTRSLIIYDAGKYLLWLQAYGYPR